MNAARGSILGFYIFQGEKIKDDYIVHYKPKTHYMAIQTKTWIHDKFLIQKTFVIFQKVNPKCYLFNNHHLLTIVGHGSHVSVEAI